ncbi:hypothetical protein SNEBB_005084 [Seison nebaliae]|nr:hypothetical protein SNEBB_005084 [Seison nebaliae]
MRDQNRKIYESTSGKSSDILDRISHTTPRPTEKPTCSKNGADVVLMNLSYLPKNPANKYVKDRLQERLNRCSNKKNKFMNAVRKSVPIHDTKIDRITVDNCKQAITCNTIDKKLCPQIEENSFDIIREDHPVRDKCNDFTQWKRSYLVEHCDFQIRSPQMMNERDEQSSPGPSGSVSGMRRPSSIEELRRNSSISPHVFAYSADHGGHVYSPRSSDTRRSTKFSHELRSSRPQRQTLNIRDSLFTNDHYNSEPNVDGYSKRLTGNLRPSRVTFGDNSTYDRNYDYNSRRPSGSLRSSHLSNYSSDYSVNRQSSVNRSLRPSNFGGKIYSSDQSTNLYSQYPKGRASSPRLYRAQSYSSKSNGYNYTQQQPTGPSESLHSQQLADGFGYQYQPNSTFHLDRPSSSIGTVHPTSNTNFGELHPSGFAGQSSGFPSSGPDMQQGIVGMLDHQGSVFAPHPSGSHMPQQMANFGLAGQSGSFGVTEKNGIVRMLDQKGSVFLTKPSFITPHQNAQLNDQSQSDNLGVAQKHGTAFMLDQKGSVFQSHPSGNPILPHNSAQFGEASDSNTFAMVQKNGTVVMLHRKGSEFQPHPSGNIMRPHQSAKLGDTDQSMSLAQVQKNGTVVMVDPKGSVFQPQPSGNILKPHQTAKFGETEQSTSFAQVQKNGTVLMLDQKGSVFQPQPSGNILKPHQSAKFGETEHSTSFAQVQKNGTVVMVDQKGSVFQQQPSGNILKPHQSAKFAEANEPNDLTTAQKNGTLVFQDQKGSVFQPSPSSNMLRPHQSAKFGMANKSVSFAIAHNNGTLLMLDQKGSVFQQRPSGKFLGPHQSEKFADVTKESSFAIAQANGTLVTLDQNCSVVELQPSNTDIRPHQSAKFGKVDGPVDFNKAEKNGTLVMIDKKGSIIQPHPSGILIRPHQSATFGQANESTVFGLVQNNGTVIVVDQKGSVLQPYPSGTIVKPHRSVKFGKTESSFAIAQKNGTLVMLDQKGSTFRPRPSSAMVKPHQSAKFGSEITKTNFDIARENNIIIKKGQILPNSNVGVSGQSGRYPSITNSYFGLSQPSSILGLQHPSDDSKTSSTENSAGDLSSKMGMGSLSIATDTAHGSGSASTMRPSDLSQSQGSRWQDSESAADQSKSRKSIGTLPNPNADMNQIIQGSSAQLNDFSKQEVSRANADISDEPRRLTNVHQQSAKPKPISVAGGSKSGKSYIQKTPGSSRTQRVIIQPPSRGSKFSNDISRGPLGRSRGYPSKSQTRAFTSAPPDYHENIISIANRDSSPSMKTGSSRPTNCSSFRDPSSAYNQGSLSTPSKKSTYLKPHIFSKRSHIPQFNMYAQPTKYVSRERCESPCSPRPRSPNDYLVEFSKATRPLTTIQPVPQKNCVKIEPTICQPMPNIKYEAFYLPQTSPPPATPPPKPVEKKESATDFAMELLYEATSMHNRESAMEQLRERSERLLELASHAKGAERESLMADIQNLMRIYEREISRPSSHFSSVDTKVKFSMQHAEDFNGRSNSNLNLVRNINNKLLLLNDAELRSTTSGAIARKFSSVYYPTAANAVDGEASHRKLKQPELLDRPEVMNTILNEIKLLEEEVSDNERIEFDRINSMRLVNPKMRTQSQFLLGHIQKETTAELQFLDNINDLVELEKQQLEDDNSKHQLNGFIDSNVITPEMTVRELIMMLGSKSQEGTNPIALRLQIASTMQEAFAHNLPLMHVLMDKMKRFCICPEEINNARMNPFMSTKIKGNIQFGGAGGRMEKVVYSKNSFGNYALIEGQQKPMSVKEMKGVLHSMKKQGIDGLRLLDDNEVFIIKKND